MVLRAGGARRADLGGLLPEARRPQRQLTLPLQVRRLHVERADDDHVAVEALEVGVGEAVDEREVGLGGGGRRERAVGREDADGARVVGAHWRESPFYASPRPGWPSGRSFTTDAAIRRTFSTDSSSPTEMRMPSPANGRTMRPAASNASAIAIVSAPAGSQTKLPCASGTRHPASRRPAASRSRRSAIVAHALEQLRLGVEARERRLLGVRRDGERDAGAARGVEDPRMPDRVADAQPREPERLREGAQDDDVRLRPAPPSTRSPSTASGSVTNSAYASSRMTSTSDGHARRRTRRTPPA